MEEFDLLNRMDTVEAPLGFEQRVMTQLASRKKKRQRARRLSYSLATAAASLTVLFMVVNFLIIPGGDSSLSAGLDEEISPLLQTQPSRWNRMNTIPITESINYSGELRSVNRQPRTIYILEQVSDRTDAKIIY